MQCVCIQSLASDSLPFCDLGHFNFLWCRKVKMPWKYHNRLALESDRVIIYVCACTYECMHIFNYQGWFYSRHFQIACIFSWAWWKKEKKKTLVHVYSFSFYTKSISWRERSHLKSPLELIEQLHCQYVDQDKPVWSIWKLLKKHIFIQVKNLVPWCWLQKKKKKKGPFLPVSYPLHINKFPCFSC